MKQPNRILLLGGTGKLGKEIIKSKLFDQIYFPCKKKCNLEEEQKKTLFDFYTIFF